MYRRNLCYTNKSIERNTTFAMSKHAQNFSLAALARIPYRILCWLPFVSNFSLKSLESWGTYTRFPSPEPPYLWRKKVYPLSPAFWGNLPETNAPKVPPCQENENTGEHACDPLCVRVGGGGRGLLAHIS